MLLLATAVLVMVMVAAACASLTPTQTSFREGRKARAPGDDHDSLLHELAALQVLPVTISRTEGGVGGAVVVVAGATAAAAAVAHRSALTPILTFVGVIAVALLTAFFTKQRQNDQIDAETQRLERTLADEAERLQTTLSAESLRLQQQLTAENDRLQRQLTHDRELQDLAELRSVVDQALQATEVAKNAFLDCRRVALRPTFDPELYSKAYNAVQHTKKPMMLAYVRVTARGQNELAHALSETYKALSVPNLNHEILDLARRTPPWDVAGKKLADWHAAAINLARTLVASKIPRGSSELHKSIQPRP